MDLTFLTAKPITSYKIIIITLLLFGLSVFTRFLPFWLKGFFEKSDLLKKISKLLPCAIMLLLTLHTLDGVKVSQYPYSIPEAASLIVAIGLYAWKRNLLLSLSVGTPLYVLLIN